MLCFMFIIQHLYFRKEPIGYHIIQSPIDRYFRTKRQNVRCKTNREAKRDTTTRREQQREQHNNITYRTVCIHIIDYNRLQ
jgi:hypothetical protein